MNPRPSEITPSASPEAEQFASEPAAGPDGRDGSGATAPGPRDQDGASCEESVLFSILEQTQSSAAPAKEVSRLDGVVIGTLAGLDDLGQPLVDFRADDFGRFRIARSTVSLGEREIGRDIALMFENGDPAKPIVIGLIQDLGDSRPAPVTDPVGERREMEANADDERIVFTAEKEIVLRCGESSITLTRAGKILIRGTYLLSRSSGVNRIKGGSVQIN